MKENLRFNSDWLKTLVPLFAVLLTLVITATTFSNRVSVVEKQSNDNTIKIEKLDKEKADKENISDMKNRLNRIESKLDRLIESQIDSK